MIRALVDGELLFAEVAPPDEPGIVRAFVLVDRPAEGGMPARRETMLCVAPIGPVGAQLASIAPNARVQLVGCFARHSAVGHILAIDQVCVLHDERVEASASTPPQTDMAGEAPLLQQLGEIAERASLARNFNEFAAVLKDLVEVTDAAPAHEALSPRAAEQQAMSITSEALAAERYRVANILLAVEAQGRMRFAQHLAIETTLSVREAIAALQATPAEHGDSSPRH